jgi:hypothetical protein
MNPKSRAASTSERHNLVYPLMRIAGRFSGETHAKR